MPIAYEMMMMPDLHRLGAILLMLIFISVLIIAHELGHFYVARLCGIKVERFGFGLPFGPTLWSKKIGDVEYCVHAALFGGYVSFPDDDPDNPLPKDSPERFENKSLGSRFAVMVAGVTVNAILGWVLMTIVIMGWGLATTDAAIGRIVTGYPADKAGMMSGDRIIQVGGQKITGENGDERAYALKTNLHQYKNKPVSLHVLRPLKADGTPVYADIKMDSANNFKAKLNAKPVEGETEIEQAKRAAKLEAEMVALNRPYASLQELAFTVTPNADGNIGINLAQARKQVSNPLEAGVLSARNLTDMIRMQFVALGGIFTGQTKMTDLSGPISIVNVGSNQIQRSGIESGLMMTAVISMLLAVMNLLPIPALDGGHIFFLIVEAIKGSPVRQEIREGVTQAGFIGLLLLIFFILGNDINNTFINPIKLP